MISILAVNTVVLTFLAICWSGKTWPNVFLKAGLIGLLVANGFLLGSTLGFIVQV